MSAKYSKLPTCDPDSTVIDFSSPFTYGNSTQKNYPKYFSYGKQSKSKPYRSAFTYSDGWDPHRAYDYEAVVADLIPPSRTCRVLAYLLTVLCYILMFITIPVSWWFAIKTIQQYERIVIFRLGRLLAIKGPGTVIILPCIDRWNRIDMRVKAFSVPPQMIVMADGAVVEVGADVYFRVTDPILSVSGVQDLNYSSRVISQTALQKHIAKHHLQDLTADKHAIGQTLQKDINQLTLTWGVEVGKIELSQVKVLQESNPLLAATADPLTILSKVFFGGGNGNAGSSAMPMQPFEVQGLPKLVPADPPNLGVTNEVETSGTSELVVSPSKLVAAVKPHLNEDLVRSVQTIYKFNVTGPEGGTFYLDLKNGTGSIGEGDPVNGIADVTFSLSCNNLQSLFLGQTSAFNAYMNGQLEVDGDLKSARLLQEVVDRIKESYTQSRL